GLTWTNFQIITPYLLSTDDHHEGFAFAGLVPEAFTNRTVPPGLLQALLGQPNLVFYDWELTGPRVESDLYILQLFRLAMHKAQVPATSVGVSWLRAISFKLANSTTALTRTRPNQLSLVRKSTAGLTSLELHLLAD